MAESGDIVYELYRLYPGKVRRPDSYGLFPSRKAADEDRKRRGWTVKETSIEGRIIR